MKSSIIIPLIQIVTLSLLAGCAGTEKQTDTDINNAAPIISGNFPSRATINSAYNYTPAATDADNDTLSFTVSNKPGWAFFNETTGQLAGTPSIGDVGVTENIIISVTDGGAEAKLAPFNLQVSSGSNSIPLISGSFPTLVSVDASYNFTPSASDSDGDPLVFSIVNKPDWATFNPATGQLSGTPAAAHVGFFNNILVSVSDGVANEVLPAFSIQVQAKASLDCSQSTIHCVNVNAGSNQEFFTVQQALAVANPGDTIQVFAGTYAGFLIENSGTTNAPINIIANGRVDLTGSAPGYNNVVRFQNVSYIILDGFHIQRNGDALSYDYDNACVAARGTNVNNPMHGLVIRNNEVSGCSPAGLYFSQTEGLVLENNYFHHNVRDLPGSNGQAIYLSNAGTDNVIIKNNTIIDNAGPGIHFNGDSSVGGDGIQTGHLISNNLIIGNGQNGFNMDGVQSSTFTNNVFANNNHHGVRVFQIDGQQGPRDLTFINNTFYANGGTAVKLTADLGGHYLFNNLVVANTENEFNILESTAKTAQNIFSQDSAIFSNTSSRDFRLSVGSAAINGGVSSFEHHNAPAVDLNGFNRTGLPDVGAFELGSQ